MNSRTVRVFFSSTFRDFAEERDLLVRRVFPALRARLKDRFVELIDVDLRWGITAEQAERGEVLPICLAEIDRSRPYFVGMLGDRYGWVPPAEAYPASLVERHPWLERHQGGKSVTELEILHGVLNDPAMAGRAFFYFRSAEYAHKKGGDYVSTSLEDASRQSDLKNRIRQSGFSVLEDYPTPEAFAERLEADLWEILDKAYPLDEVPDPFERISRQHAAYATPRRRLYLGGERYISWLNEKLDSGSQRILITGVSGGGKSALIANWLESYSKANPNIFVFEHYTGASTDAADTVGLVGRAIEAIKRRTNDQEELAIDAQQLLDSLPLWLAKASAHAKKEESCWIFALDSLNGILDRRDLGWFPEFLPERVHFVASCLPGDVHDALVNKGQWSCLIVNPLNELEAQTLLTSYLGRYNKNLPTELTAKIVSHPLATNPLFLRTLAEELRLFGVHEQLAERLGVYLTSKTVDDLFELVLQRVENDCGAQPVRSTMEAIWASRAGLTEQEIFGVASLVLATWAPIRFALDEALLESNGRLTFAHDYLRIAVSDRYFSGNNELAEETQSAEALHLRRQAHISLAQWFEAQPVDARVVEEIPFQWKQAKDWEKLQDCLTNKEIFTELCDNRTNQEILSYWLDLEKEAGADIEADYERAWVSWALNEESKETGVLADNLHLFLEFAGRFKDFSDRLSLLSLDNAIREYGESSAYVIPSLTKRASLLESRGEWERAELLYQHVLDIYNSKIKKDDLNKAYCLSNLASIFHHKGNYSAAVKLSRQALEIAEFSLEKDGLDVAKFSSNYAEALAAIGESDASERLLERALKIFINRLGAGHPDTAKCYYNLAWSKKRTGDFAKSEEYYCRCIDVYEKVLGQDHPSTALVLSDYAKLLGDLGKNDEALLIHSKVLKIREVRYGCDSHMLADSLILSGLYLAISKRYIEAELYLRRFISIMEKEKIRDKAADGRNALANVLRSLGRDPDTMKLVNRGDFLSIISYAKIITHHRTSTTISSLDFIYGSILASQNDNVWGREISVINQTIEKLFPIITKLEFRELVKPIIPMFTRMALSDEFRKLLGRFSTSSMTELFEALTNHLSEPLYRRAIALEVETLGENHLEVGATYLNFGVFLRDSGKLIEAEEVFNNALNIFRMNEGERSLSEASTLSAMGQLYKFNGDFIKAEDMFLRSMDIRCEKLDPSDNAINLVKARLAELYRMIGRSSEAEAILRIDPRNQNQH